MHHPHQHPWSKAPLQVARELLSKEDRSMLAPGASISHCKKLKLTAEVVLNCICYELKSVLSEFVYLWDTCKIFNYLLVSASLGFVALLTSWIWQTSTVKNKASTVATFLV
jgi:hypothetical protein